jgi:hypothetical protein
LVTKLIETELEKQESVLAKACQSANHDHTLTGEIEDWQAFEDDDSD